MPSGPLNPSQAISVGVYHCLAAVLKLNDLAETATQAQIPDAAQLVTLTAQITVVITDTTSVLRACIADSTDLLTLDGNVLDLNDVAAIVAELLHVRLLFPCF